MTAADPGRLHLLAVPHVAPPRRETLNGRPIALDWPKARVLSAHEDVAAALATVRDLEATTDAELLVLAVPMPPSDVVQAGLMPPWFSIAEGHHLVAWARLERRAAGTGRRDVGIPRARLARDGRRLLCGWSTCGGVIAELIDLPVGAESPRLPSYEVRPRSPHRMGRRIYPVETLVRAWQDREREGLPTWVVRGQARRLRTHPRIAEPLRARQRRAMESAAEVISREANFIDPYLDAVALLECPRCVPGRGKPAVSLVVTGLLSGWLEEEAFDAFRTTLLQLLNEGLDTQ